MTDATVARVLVGLLAVAPWSLLALPAETSGAASNGDPTSQQAHSAAGRIAQRMADDQAVAPLSPTLRQLAPLEDADAGVDGQANLVSAEAAPARVFGKVVNLEGQPVADARVRLVPITLGPPKEPSRTAGELPDYLEEEAPALVAMVGELAATGLGIVPGTVPAVPTEGPTFATEPDPAAAAQSTATDTNGDFELSFVPSGSDALWVSSSLSGATAHVPLIIAEGRVPLKITLKPPAPISPAASAQQAPEVAPLAPRLFTLPPVELETRSGGVYITQVTGNVGNGALRVGDKLVSVGGEKVWAAAQARAMLRGKRHSQVRLVLVRAGKRERVELTRP